MLHKPTRPSKAPASTRCQRCLRFGHYTYECKESATERPYISRPSRTQQLLNPKLIPSLHDKDVPEEFKSRQGIADQILSTKDKERKDRRGQERHERRARSRSAGRKRESGTEKDGERPARRYRRRVQHPIMVFDISPSFWSNMQASHSRTSSPSRPSSSASDQSYNRSRPRKSSRSRSPERSSRRHRHRRSRDRSAKGDGLSTVEITRIEAKTASPDRRDSAGYDAFSKREDTYNSRHSGPAYRTTKERSLSPYSARLALTREMNDHTAGLNGFR